MAEIKNNKSVRANGQKDINGASVELTGARRKQKPRARFHGGTFVALLVLLFVIIYMATAAYAFMNRRSIPTVDIKLDVIDSQKGIINGVIIRREEVIYSNGSGVLEFAVADKQRVKKGTTLLYITDIEKAAYYEQNIESISETINEYNSLRIDNANANAAEINLTIKDNIEKSMYRLMGQDMSELYKLAGIVTDSMSGRSQALMSENKGTIGEYAGEIRFYETELAKYVKSITAEKSGIISYYVDGMEDVFSFNALETLSYEQTLLKPEQTVSYAKRGVEANIPAARIITGNDWYIAAYIDSDDVEDIKSGSVVRLYLQKGDAVEPMEMTVNHVSPAGDKVYVVFKSTKNIIEYMDIRNVMFKLTDSAQSGLKLPSTAIVKRTFVKVPEHIVKDGTVIKRNQAGGETRLTVSVNRTNAPPGYTYILLDFAKMAIGDTLLPHDENEGGGYIVSENDFLGHTGVYRVVGPTAKFVCIDEEGIISAGGYVILDPARNPSLRPFDRVVVDGANIAENQVID